MSELQIYLLFVLLPGLDEGALLPILTGLIVILISSFVLIPYYCDKSLKIPDEAAKKAGGAFKAGVAILSCGWLMAVSLPNEREIKTMVGAYVVTNIEGVNRLPANIIKAANKFLEDYTE